MPAINEGLCGYYGPMIKPCPFCGCNKAVTWHIGHRDLPWMVECMGCMAEGPWAKTEGEAIELWNRRVKE